VPFFRQEFGDRGEPTLNIPRILAELKAERRRLNRAIAALEKLTYLPQKEKRSSRSGSTLRRTQPGTSLSSKDRGGEDQPGKNQRGNLLMFRKPRKNAHPRTSHAEEA
jgi:hypothetical protein